MIIILKLTQNFQICTAQAETSPSIPKVRLLVKVLEGKSRGDISGIWWTLHGIPLWGLDWDASSFSCFFLSFPIPKVRTVLWTKRQPECLPELQNLISLAFPPSRKGDWEGRQDWQLCASWVWSKHLGETSGSLIGPENPDWDSDFRRGYDDHFFSHSHIRGEHGSCAGA